MTDPAARRLLRARRAARLRSILGGTAAAFAGGALVVALQTVFTLVSARYPPVVQGLHCNFIRPAGPGAAPVSEAEIADGADAASSPDGALLPAIALDDDIACTLDAPGADYAAWALGGRDIQYRSGPLDPALACQNAEGFAAQSPDNLRLAICQRFALREPGVHTLNVKVMARGLDTVDRAQLRFIVRPATPPPPPQAPPPAAATRATSLHARLILPPRSITQERRIPVSESLNEHTLIPTSRDYSWIVYRLAPGETYVASRFQANSASNASATRVAYQAAQRAVSMAFTLRSGPIYDRWRGWLSGAVIVALKHDEPPRAIDLPAIALTLPGASQLDLPADLPASALADARLRLTSESGSVAEAPLDSPLILDDLRITPRLADGKLTLDAAPN